jgi:hypothetical protein
MVDLGWSWWVTTVIAAGVALVAALVFVRTGLATIRAVAALVLVEAVAIAIIAPFVMKTHHKAGATAMSAAPLSRTDFAQKADANCSKLYAFVGTLGKPKTPVATERFLDQLLPAFWQKIVEQGQLQAPASEQPTAAQWMNAMAAYGRDQEALRIAASRSDTKAMGRANARAGTDAKASARLSKALGLHVCFQ